MLPLAFMALVAAAPSNQGHWFGDQPAAVTFTWTAPAAVDATMVDRGEV